MLHSKDAARWTWVGKTHLYAPRPESLRTSGHFTFAPYPPSFPPLLPNGVGYGLWGPGSSGLVGRLDLCVHGALGLCFRVKT